MKQTYIILCLVCLFNCSAPQKTDTTSTQVEVPDNIIYFESMMGKEIQAINREHSQFFPAEGADLMVGVYDKGSFMLVLYTLAVASEDLLYFVTYDKTNGSEIDRKMLEDYLELENLGDGSAFEVPLSLGNTQVTIGENGEIMVK